MIAEDRSVADAPCMTCGEPLATHPFELPCGHRVSPQVLQGTGLPHTPLCLVCGRHEELEASRVAYRGERVALYRGDCREIFSRTCCRGAFDVVMADPPRRETALSWDGDPFCWLNLARQLLRPSGSVWFLCSLTALIATDLSGWRVGEELVWEKHNGSGSSRRSLNRVHELAVQLVPRGRTAYRGDCLVPSERPRETFTRRARTPHQGAVREHEGSVGGTRRQSSVVFARSMHRIGTHPTEKPEEILRVLLRCSCPPGGLVASLFAGSGADLRAARGLGMRAIGAETDGEYCQRAAERLAP